LKYKLDFDFRSQQVIWVLQNKHDDPNQAFMIFKKMIFLRGRGTIGSDVMKTGKFDEKYFIISCKYYTLHTTL